MSPIEIHKSNSKIVKSCIRNCYEEARNLMNNQSNVFNVEHKDVLSDKNLILSGDKPSTSRNINRIERENSFHRGVEISRFQEILKENENLKRRLDERLYETKESDKIVEAIKAIERGPACFNLESIEKFSGEVNENFEEWIDTFKIFLGILKINEEKKKLNLSKS